MKAGQRQNLCACVERLSGCDRPWMAFWIAPEASQRMLEFCTSHFSTQKRQHGGFKYLHTF